MKLMQYIGRGHYRVSDKTAGDLARKNGGKLPRPGYELSVVLPGGERAALLRTPFRSAPRGWVWAVLSLNDLSQYQNDHSGKKGRRSLRNGNAATKKRRLRVAVPARVTFDIENEGRAGWSIVGQGYDEHENPTKKYKFLNAPTKAAAIEQATKAASRAIGDGGVTYDEAVVFVGGEKHSSFEREVFGARKGAMLFFEVNRPYTSAASSKIRGAWEITAVGQDKRGMDVAHYRDFPKKATQAEAIAVAIREATRMVNDGGQYIEAQIDTPDHDLITIKRDQRAFAANGRRSSRGRR